jgi:ATP phosphoribosyltransferase regulatory subunit
MAVESLQELGFSGFKMDLGQAEFFRGIIAEAGFSPGTARDLQEAIAKKDLSEVRLLLEREPVADRVKEEVAALPRLFGGVDVLDQAAASVRNDRSRRGLDNLAAVVDILALHGIRDQLTIDLGEIRGLHYHSGITFEGFVPGLGQPVCSGGRYDRLMERYGQAAPATGFAFDILGLLPVLPRSEAVEAAGYRDLLVFNLKADRSEALAVTTALRRQGYSVARDIIRRDREQSLEYARRMNIRGMLIIGETPENGQLSLVSVADGATRSLSLAEVLAEGAREVLGWTPAGSRP